MPIPKEGESALGVKEFTPREPVKPAPSEKEGQANTEGETVLSPEEFATQYGKVKVRYQVNGQEVVRDATEIVSRDQLYSGREASIEQRNAESKRLLEEHKQLLADAKKEKPAPVVEPDLEDEDPGVFVDTRINPVIEKINQRIDSLFGSLAPVINEAQFKGGKTVAANLVGDGADDYEERRQEMIEVFERKAGFKLEDNVIAQIQAPYWGQAYLVVRARAGVKAPAKPNEEKPVRKVTVVPAGGGPGSGSGGGNLPSGSPSASLKNAIEGKIPWAKHLATKIKPAPRRETG